MNNNNLFIFSKEHLNANVIMYKEYNRYNDRMFECLKM